MEVHKSPSQLDVFDRGEAEGFEDLEGLEIKVRIARGSGWQDVGDSAVRADAHKKQGGLERVGTGSLGRENFARWLWQSLSQFR
jgi:hypothetical protein